MMGLQLVLGVAVDLSLLWIALLAALWWAQRRNLDKASLREALRLLPDVVRLLRRLARDPALPRGVRLRLLLLLGYLMIPIDLVPDFIPVLGYADDAIIVANALRSVIRHAGVQAIEQHWPGSAAGLLLLTRLAGLPNPASGTSPSATG
jgi:uncharacterized membrane protein YkvA (DUF1232 family)